MQTQDTTTVLEGLLALGVESRLLQPLE